MWIEITVEIHLYQLASGSSPTRGMWIEMTIKADEKNCNDVIPHTGDVD